MAIQFHTEEITYRLNNKKVLKRWINACIEAEGFYCGDLNIILCTDEFLLKMNIEFLHHNYYTDIITFDYRQGKTINGDLYISIERVKDNANKNRIAVKTELYRVIIHGVMHICGYKDKKISEQKTMRTIEDKYLKIFE